MGKSKRSYFLPGKLVTAFDKECKKFGYVREKVVAASLQNFLDSDAVARAKMFERLSVFVGGKK